MRVRSVGVGSGASRCCTSRVPWACISELVGQRDLPVTTNTYARVLIDEGELDYPTLLS